MVGNVVCTHCDSLIPGDSKFCPNCGAEYQPIIPETPETYIPVPPPPTFSQSQDQSFVPNFSPEPKKSKKSTFIIIAVVAVILICVCVLGIILISSINV